MTLVHDLGPPSLVERIRRFDRFYERRLRKAVRPEVREDLSAAEVRLLNELWWLEGGCPGATLSHRLDLDPSYLSRMLRRLSGCGLVTASDGIADARMRLWQLTPLGRKFADGIEDAYRDRVLNALFDVLPSEHERLVLHSRWMHDL